MPSNLLSGPSLWQRITVLINSSRHVFAAISYVGRGASKLIPLRRGHVLVVDMSLQAVGQGVTDPREIARLMHRGVKVFTRSNLHAKLILTDKRLVVGSANASRNSATVLDEAALDTSDPFSRREARRFLEDLCTEPVRERYLRKCIAAYRPPRFKAAAEGPRAKGARHPTARPKLWIVGGLRYFDVPERERKQAKAAERRAGALRHKRDGTYVDQVHYPRRNGIVNQLRPGDWVVESIRDRRTSDVLPPRQLLSVESYSRGRGKRRWTLQFEAPNADEALTLAQFRRRTRDIVKVVGRRTMRTQPIRSVSAADAIMRLWTPNGRVSRAPATRVRGR